MVSQSCKDEASQVRQRHGRFWEICSIGVRRVDMHGEMAWRKPHTIGRMRRFAQVSSHELQWPQDACGLLTQSLGARRLVLDLPTNFLLLTMPRRRADFWSPCTRADLYSCCQAEVFCSNWPRSLTLFVFCSCQARIRLDLLKLPAETGRLASVLSHV